MTHSQPVARVVKLLQANGYELANGPLRVGTLSFEFAATLFGTAHSFDMVLVADMITEPGDSALLRKVEAVGRALDMIESRRSFTLIVVGPQLGDITVREASRVCRVLAVGTPTGRGADQQVRDALSVLLPLTLPAGAISSIHPLDALRANLNGSVPSEVEEIIERAKDGSEAVRESLRRWLVSTLPEAD